MIQEINDAIRNHQDTAVNGVITIAGTLAGSVFALLLTWFYDKAKLWGRIRFKVMGVEMLVFGDTGVNINSTVQVRASNPTAACRSITVDSVAFFDTLPKWWRGRSRPIPIPITSAKFSGQADDWSLTETAFTHFAVEICGRTDRQNLQAIRCIAWMQVTITLFPNRKHDLWVEVDKAHLKQRCDVVSLYATERAILAAKEPEML